MGSSESVESIVAYSIYKQSHEKDVNLAPPVIKTVWILLSISTLVVIARLLVKWRTTRRLYLDDHLMTVALILGYLHASFLQVSVYHGFGRHVVYLEPDDRKDALHYGFISLIWSYLSPMFGRISFCVFLLYVSDTDPLLKKWPIYTFIASQALANIAAAILLAATCGTHLEVIWDANFAGFEKYCIASKNQADFAYFAGAVNTTTDVFLTVYPGLMVAHTKLSTTQKLSVASVLCLSVLAFVSSIVRTTGANALNDIADYSYDLAPYVIWVVIEMNIVMTITSLPYLRPLAIKARGLIWRHLTNKTQNKDPEGWEDTISLRSMPRDKRCGVGVVALSGSSSQDQFTSQQDPDSSIVRTVEVSVSHSDSDSPFVHAALVGLVQGELMERLAGR